MKTFAEYVAAVACADYQTRRAGQAAFNILSEVNPALAEKIRGTDYDPFYDNNRLPVFFEFLSDIWED